MKNILLGFALIASIGAALPACHCKKAKEEKEAMPAQEMPKPETVPAEPTAPAEQPAEAAPEK